MKDGISGLSLVASLVPAVVTATTKGSHADLQGYNAATLIITTGAIAGDGVFDVKLQHADTTDDGDFTCAFASLAGRVAGIGRLADAPDILKGRAGTVIRRGETVLPGGPALSALP